MFIETALWFSAIGAGLMAGIYFAFSAFIMRALSKCDKAAGIQAMQVINREIVKTSFLPLFFATSLVSLGLAALPLFTDTVIISATTQLAGFIYFVGMFLCTVAFNVPLNNQLDQVDPKTSEGKAVWQHYLSVWTRWNHLRTIACLVSCILFILALR